MSFQKTGSYPVNRIGGKGAIHPLALERPKKEKPPPRGHVKILFEPKSRVQRLRKNLGYRIQGPKLLTLPLHAQKPHALLVDNGIFATSQINASKEAEKTKQNYQVGPNLLLCFEGVQSPK